MTVVEATEPSVEGLGASVQDIAAYFYMDERLVLSTQMESLHRSFDFLMDLDYQIGLRKNVRKTVSMAFQSCHTPGCMS